MRRAVDLSSGGSPDEGQFESEAELARKELEAKYMRLRQQTSELRGRDLELARLLEDKMRVLGEMLVELGVEGPAVPHSYLHLVQERKDGERDGATKEQVLEQVQEAVKLASGLYSSGASIGRSASSVGELQTPGYESPGLPRRAETFGGFDATKEGDVKGLVKGKDGLPGPLLVDLEPGQQAAAVQLTHHLNNILCMVSEHFTSLEGFKVELAECKERAALGWGRYKHNQQLEELRIKQEQMDYERRSWAKHKEEQERELTEKLEAMTRNQSQLEQEKKDVEQQRNKLFRKLEALRDQGFEVGKNMTVIGPSHLASQQAEPSGFIMEVRKAVSPGSGPEGRKQAVSAHSSLPMGDRKPSSLPPPPQNLKKGSESKNHHLLSATNESKGDLHEVKQVIPIGLAKLSMGGPKMDKKNRSCSKIEKPSISAPIPLMGGSGQMLPFKLSESDRKASAAQLPSPKAGYTKLSSNSFAEERVGRAAGREEGTAHARTGSSPATMSGRPMSNTLPKSVGRGPSPAERQQSEIQKVNYANSGEEVFYF